jgi:hypothetical protein
MTQYESLLRAGAAIDEGVVLRGSQAGVGQSQWQGDRLSAREARISNSYMARFLGQIRSVPRSAGR